MKIRISDEIGDISTEPRHLDQLVDVLVLHGNSIQRGAAKWRSDQGGWYTQLEKPIDFDLIEKVFDLPSSIHLQRAYDSIFCAKTWCYIRGGKHGTAVHSRPQIGASS